MGDQPKFADLPPVRFVGTLTVTPPIAPDLAPYPNLAWTPGGGVRTATGGHSVGEIARRIADGARPDDLAVELGITPAAVADAFRYSRRPVE